MFFGLGWALTSCVALNYFQSMILPQSFGGWLYFLMTFIGHYGVMLSLAYFLLYAPVILLFPTYYVSRIWSIVLILVLNLGIFFDSYLFGRFHFHADSFLWDILQEEKNLDVFGLTPVKLSLLALLTFTFFVVFWIRGENLWRRMCARFSNPIKNWYLVLVLVFFTTSHLIHMFSYAEGGGPITRIANLFPLNFPIKAKSLLKEHGMIAQEDSAINQKNAKLYYPANSMNCSKAMTKNVLLIMIDQWSSSWDKTQTPNINHYAKHSLNFINHHSGGFNSQDGYFSLMYSLPPIYSTSAIEESIKPAFMAQLERNKTAVSFFKTDGAYPAQAYFPNSTASAITEIGPYLTQRKESLATDHFLMQVYLSGGQLLEKDQQVKDILNSFMAQGLVEQTIIIVTGSFSDDLTTPLFVIWPGKRPAVISKFTSHYDVLSTLMLEEMKCKNKMLDISLGKNLFAPDSRFQYVSGNYHHLVVMDSEDKSTASIDDTSKLHVKGTKNPDLKSVLDALNRMTIFYRPR